MKLLRFFVTGYGAILTVVAVLLSVCWAIKSSNDRKTQETRKHSVERPLGTINPAQKVDSDKPDKEHVLEDHKLSPVPMTTGATVIPANYITTSKAGTQQLVAFYSQVNPTPEPTPTPEPKRPVPPEIWLPRGTLIPCMLVNTVESSHINTPVIGTVLKNVFQNGNLIIPVHAMVTCWAQSGAVRDRIEVAGKWSIIYPDGKEFTLEGVACDREADPQNEHFGLEDGSAGLQGEIITSDHWANAKAFISLLITTATQTGTAIATSALQANHTTGVTAFPDTTPIMAKYLDQLLNGETGDGRFVRVRSSKEFYIFTASVVEPTKRSIGARRQAEEDYHASPLAPISPDKTLDATLRAIDRLSQPSPSPTPPRFQYP
jgi:hypothetical protein